MTEPVELFYSYAHEDERLRKKLETHLSMLRHQGLIAEWYDRNISGGSEWAQEIDERLRTAKIILRRSSSCSSAPISLPRIIAMASR